LPSSGGFVAKKIIVLLLFGSVLALAGCLWFGGRNESALSDGYTLVPVQYGRAVEVVNATGVVQARDLVTVGTELPGKVVEVRADFNEEVSEGDLLARLDDRSVRARLKQAEFSMEEARAGLKQAEATRDAAATVVRREQERSPEIRREIDVELARHQLESAEAAVEVQRTKALAAEDAKQQASDDLRLTEIRAPVLAEADAASAGAAPQGDGLGALASPGAAPRKRTFTVLDRSVSVNQIVGPPASGRLFTLAAGMDQLQIDVHVPEGDVTRIRRGQTAEVKGPGADDAAALSGRVEAVHLTPSSERGAVFYEAVVGVRNDRDSATRAWRLRPGMTANVDVQVRVHDPVWKMPASALTFQPDPAAQTEAARAKLARWQEMKDRDWWRPVWVLGADRKPQPIFVRTGGRDAKGETGVQSADYTEVLEWDAEVQPIPPRDERAYPQVITAAPPPKPSWFVLPKIKL
jgi:HlyD family secretion protein